MLVEVMLEKTLSFDTVDVFTPTTAAVLTFVERDQLNSRLVNSLMTPGKQIVVFGRSGGGKTTLLKNKLHQLYERHVTTKCTAATSFEQCVLDAFDQLSPFYLSQVAEKTSKTGGVSLTSTYLDIKGAMSAGYHSEEGKTNSRMLPPQLTPSLLANLLGEAKACWVLEDFHKVTPEERVHLAQTMKLFMDTAADHKNVKVIAIGAMSSARQIVEADGEMWTRIAEIEVDLMDTSELRQIIEKGEELLNVKFPDDIKELIAHHSNGLASVCHQICLNMCFDANIFTSTDQQYTFNHSDLKEAIALWVADANDTLRKEYDQATANERTRKYDNCRFVLHAVASADKFGVTHAEALQYIRQSEPEYPPGNVTTYLRKLTSPDRGAILIHDIASGRYRMSSPLMHAYVRARSKERTTQANTVIATTSEHERMLISELLSLFKDAKI